MLDFAPMNELRLRFTDGDQPDLPLGAGVHALGRLPSGLGPVSYTHLDVYKRQFYEFGTNKDDPANAAKTLRTSPWTVAVGGHCAKPGKLSLDDLLKGLTPQERLSLIHI